MSKLTPPCFYLGVLVEPLMLFVWALSPPATEDPAILCLSLFELFDLKMDIFGVLTLLMINAILVVGGPPLLVMPSKLKNKFNMTQ